MELPTHPSRTPETAQATNPYYKSNPALAAANTEMVSSAIREQAGLEQAQAQQAYAQADKMAAENAILQQAGLGNPAAMAPQVSPSQQLAEGILGGQLDPAGLDALVQSGQVSPEMADEAVNMARSAGPQAPAQGSEGLGLV